MNNERRGIVYRFFAFIGRALKGLVKGVLALFVRLFVLVLIIVLFAGILTRPEPLPKQGALHLAPQGKIVEQIAYVPPLSQLLNNGVPPETLLRDLVDTINAGANDKRITSLILDLNQLTGASLPQLEALGEALKRFKDSRKPIVAIADNLNQSQYYLASHADNIYLNPFGAVEITGFGTFRPYFKDALDKLKINLHVFKVGVYKDAVEPFTRTGMSDASRQHNSEWINALWGAYTSQVETLRGLPKGALDEYIRTIDTELARLNGDAAQLAVQAGLVDGLKTREQTRQALIELAGADSNDGYRHVSFQRYRQEVRKNGLLSHIDGGNKIAVVVASGTIQDGEQPAGSIGGDSLAGLLHQVCNDDAVKALVLRVDSPGGSATASEIIRQQVLEIKQKGVPVIVSMGTYAASGGYWISANADEIWASPTTLTGSIGVFGLLPTFEKSLSALGVNVEGVGSTELAGFGLPMMPLNDKAGRVIQTAVDGIYRKFLELVAAGRNSTPEEVHQVAQGRVWTGARARELGLVDNLGGLPEAIAAAATLADLKDYRVEYVEKPLSFGEQVLRELSDGAAHAARWAGADQLVSPTLQQAIKQATSPLGEALQSLNDPNGYYLRCYVCLVEL